MEEIHKNKTNGIGHNSNILKDKSPTAEAITEQLCEVSTYLNDITNNFYRMLDCITGSHGDEVVVNPYERPDDDPLGSNRVYRKANKYERGELHFEAKETIQKVHSRLTNLHLNIDSYINGDAKKITDKPRYPEKKSEGSNDN
mgnify:CR=1 FL=1